jgi:hypothetical protein
MTLQSRTILTEELSDLHAHILQLSDLVDMAVEKSMEALTSRNVSITT